MSGPGKVAFSDPDALETQVVFTYPGTYELRLIVGDEASLETTLLWISVKSTNLIFDLQKKGRIPLSSMPCDTIRRRVNEKTPSRFRAGRFTVFR